MRSFIDWTLTMIALRPLTGLMLAALLALAACGRAGPLEPPPASVSAAGHEPGQVEPEVEDRPFILDRLLE